MKDFLNKDKVYDELFGMFQDRLGEEFYKWESMIEDYTIITAESMCNDMRKYCHMKDTSMSGNFCDIRRNWDTRTLIKSDVFPWGNFSDVVRSIDDDTISDEDLEKFQTWALDWFFTAFGTWGLFCNFDTFISELEYEEEKEREEIPA